MATDAEKKSREIFLLLKYFASYFHRLFNLGFLDVPIPCIIHSLMNITKQKKECGPITDDRTQEFLKQQKIVENNFVSCCIVVFPTTEYIIYLQIIQTN